MSSHDENELPTGWVREYDQSHNHPFWVDTKAKPPRAIWVHPYEDEQFLNEHPEIRARLGKGKANGKAKANDKADRLLETAPTDEPPPYVATEAPRRHSFAGKDKSSDDMRPPQMPMPVSSSRHQAGSSTAKRGFFGKIKDKAIGTKEEREEAKRQEALLMQRRAEERKRAIEEYRKQQEEWQKQEEERYRRQRQQRQQHQPTPLAGPSSSYYYQQQPVYAAPYGSPYGRGYGGGYGGGYGDGYGGGGFGGGRRAGYGGGAGDLALPLLGGLAGGLLLGDIFGGF